MSSKESEQEIDLRIARIKNELAEAEVQRGYIRAAARQKEILKDLLEQKPRA